MSEKQTALPIDFVEPDQYTPSAAWRAAGEPDPHGTQYDRERAELPMGHLTDDELANGAFMNYDRPLDIHGILNKTSHSPIAWMTAVKDRIRWLSRSLEKALNEKQAACTDQISNSQLMNELSLCRDVFHTPSEGSTHRREWEGAISDPLAVSNYVRCRVIEMRETISKYEKMLSDKKLSDQ